MDLNEARLDEQRHQLMDLDTDSRFTVPGATCPACPPCGNEEYDEYLCGLVEEYRERNIPGSPLPVFLGMTYGEYAVWAVSGIVPETVCRRITSEW